MKNIMDMYLNFTEKRIKKYMKLIYTRFYDEEIVSEYLKTYINARYYNIQNTNKPARAFYLRIIDELEYKEQILMKKDSNNQNSKMINNVKKVFAYILFFDNVRKIENFKKIESLREIIKKIMEIVTAEFNVKTSKEKEEELYKEITSDMLEIDVFLDKFETDEFSLSFESCEQRENLYFSKIEHNVKIPMQYSDVAINKVFNEGIIAEDKLQVEYILLSIIIIRDIIEGNFNDSYISEFASTLFKKKTKLESLLSIIDNQALQEKINIKIEYADYLKNQKMVLDYINRGYKFAIILDNTIKKIEDVEKLKIFNIIIASKNLEINKLLKQNKAIQNKIIYK